MDELDPLEQRQHIFSGVITTWRENYGELVTSSGVPVRFVTHGHPPLPEGAHITITVRKFHPCYHIDKLNVDQ